MSVKINSISPIGIALTCIYKRYNRINFFSVKTAFLLFSILIISVSTGAGCRTEQHPVSKEEVPAGLMVPEKGAYTGAYVDFGEGERNVSYDAITDFEDLSSKHLAIVAFGNFWGDQNFPIRSINIISGYGAVPLIFWSPWDLPYVEGRGADKFNLEAIISGNWNSYIDSWADAAKKYGKPIMVSWGLEMNGSWFPWSGKFYGAGEVTELKGTNAVYKAPELYKKCFRYVVDRVRSRKAGNIIWVFHANNFSSPQVSWNSMSNYYPGSDYVDWLGLSVYGKLGNEDDWASFNESMSAGYREICSLDYKKPLIVAEWGVAESPPDDKAKFIREAFVQMKSTFPRVRGAVYWHERWENGDGSFSNLHINSSPSSLDAYREGISDIYWIGRPIFRMVKR